LILADHRRIGRLCHALYDTARYDDTPRPDWMLGHVWQRLADLLVVHTQAEEETCYLSLLGTGGWPSGCEIRSPTTRTSVGPLLKQPCNPSGRQRGGIRSGPSWRSALSISSTRSAMSCPSGWPD
jgi:hypothetical protein